MKKELLLFLLIPSLCCCIDNSPEHDKKIIKDFGAISETNVCFSIGLGETKYVPINDLFNCILNEYELNYDFVNQYLDQKILKFNIFDNDGNNINSTFDYSLIGDSYAGENVTLYHSIYAFEIKCNKSFQSDININYLEIENANAKFIIGIKMTIEFNNDFVKYPEFLPSYNPDGSGRMFWKTSYNTQPYFSNVIQNKALVFDFRRTKLKNSQILLNGINFSSNLNQIVECNLYTKFIESEVMFWNEFERNIDQINYNKFDDPINFFDYTNDGEAIMFYVKTKTEANNMIVGDVIYDITIDGEQYFIKDMFIFNN